MHRDICIVGRDRICQDVFSYEVIDDKLRRHTVHINESLLEVEPTCFIRKTDEEHLDILAAGAVMMEANTDVVFHRVDREMVDRAYEAVLRVKSMYELG